MTMERATHEIEFSMLTTDDVSQISHLIVDMSENGDELRLRDKSADYYRWMYFQNPAGPAFGCVARHRGRVVSSFAVAPKVMQIGNQTVRVGKTMDMFTDPDYQGMGLIKGCADRVFAAARSAGLHGWYVTPSVNSYPIFTGKWGYREDFEIVFRARILNFEAVLDTLRPGIGRRLGRSTDRVLASLRNRSPSPAVDADVVELQGFDERMDDLWSRVAPGYGVAIVRDAAYMNWRYVENPDEYVSLGLQSGDRLRGVVVMKETRRKGLRIGEVVDLVCPADDARTLRRLIRLAAAACRSRDCALVESWSIPGTKLDRRIMRAGLPLPRTRVKFLLSPGFADPVIYDKHAWLLTQGDGNDV